MEVLGESQPPRRRRLDAGKVLGLVRIDAPEGGRGKPCGASHIPKHFKCGKSTSSATLSSKLDSNLKGWVAAGISVAAVGGIAAVIYNNKQTRKRALEQLRDTQLRNRARKVEEHDAIYWYVAGSQGLNRALREGKELNERYETIRDGLDSWLSDVPKDKGIFFRGIPERARSEWSTIKAGQVITDKAYTSFSKSREVANMYGDNDVAANSVLIVARGGISRLPMHISNSNGRRLPEGYADAQEHLTARNTQYKVLRVRTIKEKYALSRASGTAVRSSSGTHIRTVRVVYVDIIGTK